jgi:hypothetical protein
MTDNTTECYKISIPWYMHAAPYTAIIAIINAFLQLSGLYSFMFGFYGDILGLAIGISLIYPITQTFLFSYRMKRIIRNGPTGYLEIN